MPCRSLLVLFGLLTIALPAFTQDATIFPPQQPPREIRAERITGTLSIDGKLDEAGWQSVPASTDFFQIEPYQGQALRLDTRVKVLYDDKHLYIGAFCSDTLGRKAIRVPNLQRDFDFWTNDLFSVDFDPFRDERNAVAFQTNPFGAQRDLLCFDDTFFDREWDGLWRVRTSRTDSGWVAEMAIPWKSLRYPENGKEWGVNFMRLARRAYQFSSWSPYPRSTNHHRMAYAGVLKNLDPPPPSANVRVQPYVLSNYTRTRRNGEITGEHFSPRLGGEIKWAPNPFTVLDFTANTDFAQADADLQVQNLTRFSVFFPERRQFFLESANVFSLGIPKQIQPFFSRRIGLSSLEANSEPIPIDAGLRLVKRSPKESIGALAVQQRELGESPATTFGVGRYSRNFGKQNRLGGMVTSRYEHGREDRAASLNMTYSADAFFRIRQALTWNTMISASTTSGTEGNGIAATSQLSYFTNQWYLYYNQSVVTRDYTPGAGFVYGRDLINTDFGGFPVIRSPKLPKPIRNWDPGFFFNMFHRASDGAFQQLEWTLFPVYLIFLNGSVFYTYIIPSWQRLDYTFRPAGRDDLQVSPGSYQYTRYEVNFTSDRSRKLAYGGTYSTGGYFDGNLNQWIGFLRYSPVPHVSLLVDYTQNRFREMARENTDLVTHLITPQVRLALNPRVQLTGFYQRNTAADRDVWNVRFSWEFQPLSFLYLVYNSNAQPLLNGVNGPDRLANEQVIGKLTYLKQF